MKYISGFFCLIGAKRLSNKSPLFRIGGTHYSFKDFFFFDIWKLNECDICTRPESREAVTMSTVGHNS